ncbi:MAG: prepilin-type N-terminal cleavage/methylation domain-containing protein [Syntrophobacterales bacterium]|nr:prepilin-type N-terminal cleavage/methylation domain-containing protein [Syntrophobacterales bacterium]
METFDKQSRKACYQSRKSDAGFTIIELLIAMAVGLAVLGATYSIFILHSKTFGNQEQIAEMQQNVRAAMDFMTREIRMAGYDYTGSAGAGIVSPASNSINFTLDITSTSGPDAPDGDTDDPNENITYSLYTADGIQKLGRKSTAGAVNQPVAEHIQSLAFQYWDANGNTTATVANIRRIRVTITGKTAKPDPDYTPNGGYRTYTLTSVITPRNLGL